MAEKEITEVVQEIIENQLTEEEKTDVVENQDAEAQAAAAQEMEREKEAIAAKKKEAEEVFEAELKAGLEERTLAKAKELMESSNTKEIWLCTLTGYWFTRKDYAEEHSRSTGKPLKHYQN